MTDYKPFRIQVHARDLINQVIVLLEKHSKITVLDWEHIEDKLNQHFMRADRPDVWAKRYYKARQIVQADKPQQPPKQQPHHIEECLDGFSAAKQPHAVEEKMEGFLTAILGDTADNPIPYKLGDGYAIKLENEKYNNPDYAPEQTELTYEPDQGHCPDCRFIEKRGRLWCCRYPNSKLIKSEKHWCGEYQPQEDNMSTFC